MTICKRFSVTGRVQGVWFRAATRRQAVSLGLTGYAVNRPDGSVEVLACGEQKTVEQLHAWLWQGPPAAEVSHVLGELVDCQPPADFTTG